MRIASFYIRRIVKANLHARSFLIVDGMTIDTYIQVRKNGQCLRRKHRPLFWRWDKILALTWPIRSQRKIYLAAINASQHVVRSQSRRDNQRLGDELPNISPDIDHVISLPDSNHLYIFPNAHSLLL